MQWVKDKVREELQKGLIGPDESCQYHPCHFQGQDCSWCFCPFYPCGLPELGETVVSKRSGEPVWSCVDCEFLHRPDVSRAAWELIRAEGIDDPDDPRLAEVFRELRERFNTRAKALMVLGATSDAGKSIVATALCRVLSDMGYSVAPFKSQNMSLNSFVTAGGDEISRAQQLQAMAARVEPDFHINPILLKPKGDAVSQVVVEGRPYADLDVRSYYEGFVPGTGTEVMRRNIEHLMRKHDYLIMEGAGSPAEINIYHRDIANMGAAKAAGADCVLVVNIEKGGAFAYAYGTVMLMPEEDRALVKGILINNMRGDASCLDAGIEELELRLGVPVLGVIPHLDLRLPKEDSLGCRDIDGEGAVVAVIRLPRLSNFTDFDALELEGANVRFVEDPDGLSGADMVVIPGSKNTIGDLEWLKAKGFPPKLRELQGKVPILGICGGYQMMGERIDDPLAVEGPAPSSAEGLGLLRLSTVFDSREKSTLQVEGEAPGGGRVRGYEIHMGRSESHGQRPLFRLKDGEGWRDEGSLDEEGKLMGSYVHGLFDLPAFRSFALSMAGKGPKDGAGDDHGEGVEEGLDRLAAAFRAAIDESALLGGILGALR